MNIAPGDTSVSLIIKVVDDAGLPVTSLVAATFPSVSYVRAGAAPVSVALSDLASATAAYSSGGVYELGGGRYRFDAPNGAFSVAAHSVAIFGEATNKRVVAPEIACRYMKSDLRQWLGIGPGGLRGGLVQVFDRQMILQGVSGMSFGARTIEWGPEGIGSADDYLVGASVMIVSGTGVGQWRVVTDYTFSTGTMTVDRDWDVVPDSSSEVDFKASPDFSVFAANKLADMTIRRSMASVEASSFGDTLSIDSLYGVSQRSAHSDATTNAGKITVFKTDDTTQIGTITITSTPTGEVITSAKAD